MDNKKPTYEELESKLNFYKAVCEAYEGIVDKYQMIVELYEKKN